MTAPNGPILFNNSTGSDTAASGLGAANVYGTGASTTSASAVVTGITTTGVTAGDLLWVQASSGRQFSIIATVDSSTQVTCDDVFANTESGRTWAIGGKRATFDDASSRRIFNSDAVSHSVIETETDQSLTSTINRPHGTVYPFIFLRGSGTSPKTLTATGNFSLFAQGQSNYMVVYNLKFVGSVNNSSAAISGGLTSVIKCRFGDDGANTNFRIAVQSSVYAGSIQVRDSTMYGQGASVADGYGVRSTYYASKGVQAYNCFIKDFYYGGESRDKPFLMRDCIVSNATIGMKGRVGAMTPYNCIFNSISSHAIEHSSTTLEKWWPLNQVETYIWGRNIFSNIGGDVFHGANITTGLTETELGFHEGLTCYLYNASGFTGITFPSVTLTADPFVSAANGNFNLNDFPGGGNLLRAKYYELGG